MDIQQQLDAMKSEIAELQKFKADMMDFSQIPIEVQNALIARGFMFFDSAVRFYGGASGTFTDYIYAKYLNKKSLIQVTNGLVPFTVNITTDTVLSVNHGFSDGQQVILFSTDTLPSGLDLLTSYWVMNATADTFQLSSDNISVDDITDVGVGSHYAVFLT